MGRAVRVSVAVVEGEKRPIALLPSQEEIVCPEATFLDASLAAERELARREVRTLAVQSFDVRADIACPVCCVLPTRIASVFLAMPHIAMCSSLSLR